VDARTVTELARYVPAEALKLVLVLFLSFLVGLEREEHKARAQHYAFGGARTFPLIGLVGYGVAKLSGGNVLALIVGLVVVGALMVVSYAHKLHDDPTAGATTELSGLVTYVIGALVDAEAYWVAVAIGVITVLLLELRERMEQLTARIAREEIVAFAKFLLLALVVLPVLPDRAFTRFAINPFRTWLVIVAVSGVSYASYILQRWLNGRGGVLLAALLGGAYSSTVTTVVLARESKETRAPALYSGAALAASGMMYVRLGVLVALFDPSLAGRLATTFGGLAVLAVGAGVLIALRARGAHNEDQQRVRKARNPLSLPPAFLFGVVYLAMVVATRAVVERTGHGGLYVLGAVTGLADVDPFVLSLAQGGASIAPQHVITVSIILAAAANNIAKGVYALVFGARAAVWPMMAALFTLAVLGAVPAVLL
jgi:uncharacterized membrane protein (DUF4010 family)